MDNPLRGLTPNRLGPLPPLPNPLPPLPRPPEPFLPRIPLPDPLPQPPFPPFPPFQFRSLRCGCYLLNYTPRSSFPISYDGTIRVECHSNGRTASGDLYQRPTIFFPLPIPPIPRPFPQPQPPRPFLLPGPNPADGIPVLSRSRYRYYLRITQLLERFTVAQSFELGFEM
ncbi:MAG: hypothetical protein ACR2P3_04775 [Geminicoccaceae bacterium]